MRERITFPGLGPELAAFRNAPAQSTKCPVTTGEWLARLGGYRGPPWLHDRRKRPLRVTWHIQLAKLRANLRRQAVGRLRLGGLSFRQIGAELGISHVRARVFWRQVVADAAEHGKAKARGLALVEARMRFGSPP